MGLLEGKAALVTGGASGIGRAMAHKLASEGASVAIVDINLAQGEQEAAAIGGIFSFADVGDLDQMRGAVTEAATKFGGLDLVFVNAGVVTGGSDIEELPLETYRRAVSVNLDGVVFGVMTALPVMRPGGAFVATASLAGLVPYPGDPVYGLTKHAVVGFVRSVAAQLGERGLSINAICPGFADTPILADFVDKFHEAGFPLLAASEVADAMLDIAMSGKNGEVFICQPGRTYELYSFKGVPGPRTAGAEGMQPPVRPGE